MRSSWDRYFLDMASHASTRATCSRRKHGAVIVKNRRVVSTGYNGGPSGFKHCEDGGCPRANSDASQGSSYESCIAIHAEANAIMMSSPEEREGATIYITGAPCHGCAKLISNSGISEVVFESEKYDGFETWVDFLQTAGIRVRTRVQ